MEYMIFMSMPAGDRSVYRSVDTAIHRLQSLEGFEKIRFIILFGSATANQRTGISDIDLCVYYDDGTEESSRFRFRALSELPEGIFDIHMFLQLPLFMRMEVLRGRVVYCPNERFLYDVADKTIRDYDDFKHRFFDYIGQKAIV
jgi:predicted nucleotidyltransferase